jgi:hypothetical protein
MVVVFLHLFIVDSKLSFGLPSQGWQEIHHNSLSPMKLFVGVPHSVALVSFALSQRVNMKSHFFLLF